MARMPILCLGLALASGCATESQSQNRKPMYVVSLNISLESQIDPTTKTKIVAEIKSLPKNVKAGE